MTDQDTIARREAEAAFEAWSQEQWLWTDATRKLDAARAAYIAGYLSRHQSDRERIEALEAALLNCASIARFERAHDTGLAATAFSLIEKACNAALAAETQEQA